MKKNVLVIGGAGYVGCVLVPKLLDKGHKVTVFDIMFYGDEGLPKDHPNLTVIKGDMRNQNELAKACEGKTDCIHLACISNDPSFELDEELGKSINYDCFEPMVKTIKASGISRFVYASTSSVYGVSEDPNVTEDHPLIPLTDYNKYKGLTEKILWNYHDKESFCCVVIRPATVCGYSPRTRLDLSVNILTNLAYNNRKITVFGGEQKRPNIHVEDITDLYVQLLDEEKDKIAGETFNAGYQNYSIAEIANKVKKIVEEEYPEKAPIEIETTDSDDKRSYHISSEKVFKVLGYKPKRDVEEAVRGLCVAFRDGKLKDSLTDPKYFNIKTMKERGHSV